MKKFLSVVLAVTMMFALAVNAFAYDTGEIIPESDYLTFLCEDDNAKIKFEFRSGSMQYCINGGNWYAYQSGQDIMLEKGDKVAFKGSNVSTDDNHHFNVSIGKISASGTLNSLRLDDEGAFQGLSKGVLDNVFKDTNLILGADELLVEINVNDVLNVGNKVSSNPLTPFSGEENFDTGNKNDGKNTENEKTNEEKKDNKKDKNKDKKEEKDKNKDNKEEKDKDKDNKGKTASMTTDAGATVAVTCIIAAAGIAAGVYCLKGNKKAE